MACRVRGGARKDAGRRRIRRCGDDEDDTVYPGAKEVFSDGIDQDCEGHDGVDVICRAKHARFVVDVGVTRERLAAKARKAGLKAA